MNENNIIKPYLLKAQRLQRKYFGELTIWVNTTDAGNFSVVVFSKNHSTNVSVDFYSFSPDRLPKKYDSLLSLIKSAKDGTL